jgi:inorganic pyrophosphatase
MTPPGNYGIVPLTPPDDDAPIDVLLRNTQPLSLRAYASSAQLNSSSGDDEKTIAARYNQLPRRY